MPGHGSSWILAYPELAPAAPVKTLPVVYGMPTAVLDPTRKSTYKFIDTLVGEMGGIFPDAYFHIGGDEVNGDAWLADPQIAAFIEEGLHQGGSTAGLVQPATGRDSQEAQQEDDRVG